MYIHYVLYFLFQAHLHCDNNVNFLVIAALYRFRVLQFITVKDIISEKMINN